MKRPHQVIGVSTGNLSGNPVGVAVDRGSGTMFGHVIGILIAAALALAAGCGGLTVQTIPVTVSRYDTLAPLSLAEFVRARELFEAGDVHAARAAFERLYERLPDNVIVGIWLQEADLAAALASGGDAQPPEQEASVLAALTERWARAAADQPTVASLVLAARVASTPAEASALLGAAEALDPSCAWIPYARAWTAASASDWPAAREQIARAKASDQGHVWTYWLEAWMTTRSGSVSEAASALLSFVRRAADDPRVQPRLLAESRLDLALVWTLLEEEEEADELIARIDPRHVGAARRLMAIASVRQAMGDLAPALVAAEQAEEVAPGEMMPVVQQALLYEEWLEDPVRAEAAWRKVLDLARNSSDLTAVLERTRAGVRIERFEARRARTTPAGSSPKGP